MRAKSISSTLLALLLAGFSPLLSYGQVGPWSAGPPGPPGAPPIDPSWVSLPTDRSLRVEGGLPIEPQDPDPALLYHNRPPAEHRPWQSGQPAEPPPDLKKFMKPRFDLSAEWEPETDGVAIDSYDLSVTIPTYPIFGPPPPFITTGYSYTHIGAPAAFDVPSSLHEYSLGTAWMRKINERWMARLMLSGVFASDMDNTSSDAWQVRAGGFAVYRPNDRWSFAVGAFATGRDDIPVLPIAGLTWEPSPYLKVDLMMPKPRISRLLIDTGRIQHWGYLGGAISGGNWAYDRTSGQGDRLNYREWRLVLGWEVRPPQPPGTFIPSGKVFHTELGYVFGREFEFDSVAADISLSDTLLLRTGIRF